MFTHRLFCGIEDVCCFDKMKELKLRWLQREWGVLEDKGRNLRRGQAMRKSLLLVILNLIFVVSITWAETADDKDTKERVRDWFLKGQAALSFENYDEAIKCYENTLELDPGFTDVHRFIGDAYLRKGMLDKAMYEYKKAIAIKPNNVPAHVGLGEIYLKKGKLDDAASEYKKAIGIYPDSASAHSGLGDVYLNRGKINEAVSEYNKTIAINPDHASAHFNLGCFYIKRGDNSLAANHLYKAGVLYFRQGDREGALRAYEKLKQTESEELERILSEKLKTKSE
jgi:tetratricopeptide (TPR) repeat protein